MGRRLGHGMGRRLGHAGQLLGHGMGLLWATLVSGLFGRSLGVLGPSLGALEATLWRSWAHFRRPVIFDSRLGIRVTMSAEGVLGALLASLGPALGPLYPPWNAPRSVHIRSCGCAVLSRPRAGSPQSGIGLSKGRPGTSGDRF